MATSDHRRTNSQSDARRDDEQAQRDPLRQLGERLDRASLEARRLAMEASEAALGGAPIPPLSGWAAPECDGDPQSEPRQLDGVVAALASLRDRVPPELERRLAEALRELLIAIRALLDWYIERLDRDRPAAGEAEDIPIL